MGQTIYEADKDKIFEDFSLWEKNWVIVEVVYAHHSQRKVQVCHMVEDGQPAEERHLIQAKYFSQSIL